MFYSCDLLFFRDSSRAPDQEVDQRGHGQRLCKKIAKHVIWRGRMLWIIVYGRSW